VTYCNNDRKYSLSLDGLPPYICIPCTTGDGKPSVRELRLHRFTPVLLQGWSRSVQYTAILQRNRNMHGNRAKVYILFIIIIISIIIFTRGKPLHGDSKITKVYKDLFGSAPYSGRSSLIKPSCRKTESNRCTIIIIVQRVHYEQAKNTLHRKTVQCVKVKAI